MSMTDKFKSFSDAATMDLTDEEIKNTVQIVHAAQRTYAGRSNSPENLEKLRDEVLSRLADVNILATFDPTPCFYGEPPAIEIIGKIATDPIHKYGYDHERKNWEVQKATALGEDFLGQEKIRDE